MISFEEFCWDYLDLDPALITDEQLKSARADYDNSKPTSKFNDSKEEAKHKKLLEKAKESRKLAKFYGGKALTGSAAQKKWAEEIRSDVLESNALTDEQKIKLVTFGSPTLNSAKFWIDNKDKSPSAFNIDTLLDESKKIQELYSKHYKTLSSTATVCEKNAAKNEIYEALQSLTLAIHHEFPNCNFYDSYGCLIKGLKFK